MRSVHGHCLYLSCVAVLLREQRGLVVHQPLARETQIALVSDRAHQGRKQTSLLHLPSSRDSTLAAAKLFRAPASEEGTIADKTVEVSSKSEAASILAHTPSGRGRWSPPWLGGERGEDSCASSPASRRQQRKADKRQQKKMHSAWPNGHPPIIPKLQSILAHLCWGGSRSRSTEGGYAKSSTHGGWFQARAR